MTLGIVLDVDDTLYLERDYVASGFRAVDCWLVTNHGISGVGRRAWELFTGGRRRTTIGDALADMGASPELLGACVKVYRTHEPQIELLPDAVKFICSIRGKHPIGIITDGPSESQWAKCRALGANEWADAIIVTSDYGLSKPDVRVFQLVEQILAPKASNYIYIADNPMKDFIGPHLCGWRTTRIQRGGSLHAAVPGPDGVLTISDLAPLAKLARQ